MTVQSVLVTGDFVIDHHIYEGKRHHFAEPAEKGVTLRQQLGGAALIHHLLTADIDSSRTLMPADWRVTMSVNDPTRRTGGAPEAGTFLGSDQAYAFWRPMPRNERPDKQFWRVSEAMGFGAAPRADHPGSDAPRVPGRTVWAPAGDLPPAPSIIAVSDGGVDFAKSNSQWNITGLDTARWVVLKASGQLGARSAWQRLASVGRRLVVIVAARELRKMPFFLSSGLSWEATVRDLLRAIRRRGALSGMASCGHLVVSFETEGALWLDLASQADDESTVGPDARVQLVYDAGAIEGDHTVALEGDAYGLQSCLAAAVIRELAADLERPDLTSALDGGLCAMRTLREKGHGPATEVPDGFPARRLAIALDAKSYLYSRAAFTAADAAADGWSLLRQSQRSPGPVFDLARLVLLRGPIALANVPHGRVGAFLTSDQHETEAIRRLRQLLRGYAGQPSARKPLSIGVFGPPGAGKSFAVRQLATMVPRSTWLEFNLSQFREPVELIGAFHQIRDKILEERLPVAFFDEFDAQEYVWLKHLLAPMQDGRFLDGQLMHPLGRCVLVFAGGTSWTYGTFGPTEPDGDTAESAAYRAFRLAKGPDFKSRLDDHLDVVGPNQRLLPAGHRPSASATAEMFDGRWFDVDPADIHYPVRRALMARSELKCGEQEKPDLDRGVVNALLRVDRFAHGARSLGKVVQALAAGRPQPLRRSLLPPAPQLSMHVPAAKFMALCDSEPVESLPLAVPLAQPIEEMARAIHESYREAARAERRARPDTDVDFDELSTFLQNSNRAAADRMFSILQLAGLGLEAGPATPAEERAVRDYLEFRLEVLAEAEHEGWMAWYFSQGWRHGPRRDDDRREHHCLRPYSELPHGETQKDRVAIRRYPDVARAASLKIVFHE